MKAVVTALALLALLPAAAAAKTGLALTPPPDGVAAGEPWDVQFVYMRADAPVDPPRGHHASVRIVSEDSGRTLTFAAHLAHNGMWQARVVFPTPGRWDYSVQGFGREASRQSWDPAVIASRPKEPVVAAAGGGDGSSFPYGWTAGGAALALLTLGLVVIRLRS
jgi:hypothetical protein